MENKPLTVKELLKLCEEEVKKGHEDCSIMISDDDEGNGFHYLWFNFTMADEYCDSDVLYSQDDEIAPKSKTILLG